MSTLGIASTPGQDAEARIAERLALQAQLKGSASWFYWIGGLSLINSVIMMTGSQWHFILGMGVTTVVDVVAQKIGGVGVALGLVVNLFIAGVCCLFGYLGNKRATWAMWLGMTLYALDGALLLLFQDWLSVAFHGYALYRVYQGVPVIAQLKALESTPQAMAASSGAIG
jgi:hypothetical protein